MSWTDDYHEAGGSIADAVAAMLQDATLTSVLTKLSDSAAVPEPTVLRTVGYERDETASGDERGVWELELWVCREASDDAEAYAHGYERVLRTGQWQGYAGAYLNRITGIDTEAPLPAGRDSSGRYLWKVTVYVSAARSIV
jgi:hypothetical protein